jgi:hypothetical protein
MMKGEETWSTDFILQSPFLREFCAGIFKQSMEARNRVGI